MEYPIIIEMVPDGDGMQARATTSIERAFEAGRSIEDELRSVETDYESTIAGVREALASAGTGRSRDSRAYWLAGRLLAGFMTRLEQRGFYLVDKNGTPARHVGVSKTSVGKMIAFHRRYPDPSLIDTSIPWSVYRDNRELRR